MVPINCSVNGSLVYTGKEKWTKSDKTTTENIRMVSKSRIGQASDVGKNDQIIQTYHLISIEKMIMKLMILDKQMILHVYIKSYYLFYD